MSGRYPEKAANEFIRLLDNLESNAEYRGMDLDRLKIVNATVHKGRRIERFYSTCNGKSISQNRYSYSCGASGSGIVEMSSVKNVINDSYKLMLLKDYLREAIKEAGFSEVDIQKTPTGTRVGLHVTRPGIVIGRKGSGIRDLTAVLEKDFGLKNPQISVIEIVKPELEPSVMCNRMSQHLARGTAFRRAVMWTMQTIMEAGAMGVQITIQVN